MSSESDVHFVFFIPFLRLGSEFTIGGVEFMPLRDAEGKVPTAVESAVAPLEIILTGYVDRKGKAFSNCVVATIPGRGWDLSRDDSETITWAASLLFLSSWASNEYFTKFGGAYVNSTSCRVIGQSYGGPLPYYIALSARRRFGSTLDGGYKHGELHFDLPLQCSVRDVFNVDDALRAGLEAATASGSDVIERLRTAMPFVELANTDDAFMTLHAEGILMGSAFEQLLRGKASAYTLGRKFGALFRTFGSVTLANAKQARAGIEIDESTSERAAAQPKWWVHRKWLEELYDLRSKVVHRGTPAGRTWGWSPFEHLLMAAHVFPLTVKLLLQREGHYTLTDDDRVRCLAVDKILASPRWFENEEDDESEVSASQIMARVRLDWMFEKAVGKFYGIGASGASGGGAEEES